MPDLAGGRRLVDRQAARLARRYGDALRAADATEAQALCDEALEAGISPTAVQSLIIEPAMARIGELWAADAITVADEHLATAISHGVMVRLFEVLRVAEPASREKVLLGAAESQHHVLGLRMVGDVLEGAGFEVLYLGADVPSDALRPFVAAHKPAAVGLAYGISTHVAGLADGIRAIHDGHADARIFLGGRAVPEAFTRMGYPAIDSTLDLLFVLEQLLAGEPQPLPAELETFQSRSPLRAPRAVDVEEDAVAGRLAQVAEDTADRARFYVRKAAAMHDLALRDPLTGLANRRAFDDRLHAETAGGGRRGLGMLLMIDVDEFKSVNDTYGHEVGDQLLVHIARAIDSNVRSRDLAARVGGDEFAIVLPQADAASAMEVGERIRTSIHERARPATSVSIGVAELGADGRGAVLSADEALYRAKNEGRDRLMFGGGAASGGDALVSTTKES